MNNYCERIHKFFNILPRHTFPFNANKIPEQGIYALFETGETAHSGDRITRIGTHTGKGNLCARLKEHFITENKDRSIFRKNIGRALLCKAGDDFLNYWEIDLTSKTTKDEWVEKIDMEKQQQVEKDVTNYIQKNVSFVVIKIDDKDKRLELESRLISTVSLCGECKQSAHWLGNHSPKEKIRKSGLWNEMKLWKTPIDDELIRYIENRNNDL
ncbi:MAG: hypothetical protein Pg6A_00700 [Termitinemataceae bacterium]|jgi:hypothetical protein|nr:MAG: hypothetical protein Pg6A_00700 [Termitinemataceae bacterium]